MIRLGFSLRSGEWWASGTTRSWASSTSPGISPVRLRDAMLTERDGRIRGGVARHCPSDVHEKSPATAEWRFRAEARLLSKIAQPCAARGSLPRRAQSRIRPVSRRVPPGPTIAKHSGHAGATRAVVRCKRQSCSELHLASISTTGHAWPSKFPATAPFSRPRPLPTSH
jgi:hypothetical protein